MDKRSSLFDSVEEIEIYDIEIWLKGAMPFRQAAFHPRTIDQNNEKSTGTLMAHFRVIVHELIMIPLCT